MIDEETLWMTSKEYEEYIWKRGNGSNEAVFHYTIIEIAKSLHDIAQFLAEMNGYIQPKEGEI